MLLKLLSVFGSGMIGLWEGIPLGFALGLPPIVIAITAAFGSTLATVIVTLLGDRVRTRLVRPRPKESGPVRDRLIDRVWRRYGIIGLGLLAPGLTGAPVGVAMGLLLRAPVGRMLFWAILGIALWSAAMTGAGIYGDAGIRRLISR